MARSYPWHDLLIRWSQELIRQNLEAHLWPPNAAASHWLGTVSATEEQIQAAETRLQVTFPASYRTFLTLTNGWSVLTPFVWRVYPVEEVGWYGPRHPDNLAILRGDFSNNPIGGLIARLFGEVTPPAANDEVEISVKHLQSSLEIAGGNYTDAIEYVLNPHVQTAEGEWEAWIIRWWKPLDMERYPSFWDLMQAEYHRL